MSDQPKPNEPSDLNAQVVDLQHKLAFQQHAFEDLNSVVLQQQIEIEALQRETKSLKQHVQNLAERGSEGDLPHEKPPHY